MIDSGTADLRYWQLIIEERWCAVHTKGRADSRMAGMRV